MHMLAYNMENKKEDKRAGNGKKENILKLCTG